MATRGSGAISAHGSEDLPAVTVESYNVEIKDGEGFIGDRASKGAFYALLEEARRAGPRDSRTIRSATADGRDRQEALDKLLAKGDPEAAGAHSGRVEDFAQRARRGRPSLHAPEGVARGRANRRRRRIQREPDRRARHRARLGHAEAERHAPWTSQPIRHHPDEAGLIGCVHLAPTWMLCGS